MRIKRERRLGIIVFGLYSIETFSGVGEAYGLTATKIGFLNSLMYIITLAT